MADRHVQTALHMYVITAVGAMWVLMWAVADDAMGIGSWCRVRQRLPRLSPAHW